MVFAIERPIPLTLKMAEKRENPEKIGDVRSHLSSGGRPAKPLYYFSINAMRGVSNRAKWCPRFQDLKISLRSQDFYGISIFHRDFKISYGFQDFNEISQDLTQISCILAL